MKLPAISSKERFALLALDQITLIAQQLHLDPQDEQDSNLLDLLIKDLTELYSPELTGVVFSPEVGYQALHSKATQSGPVFCLERKATDTDPLSLPVLVPNWGVEAVRNNYAVAKLELYYNPTEQEAASKRAMLAELYDYCHHHNIDFFVDLIVYVEGTEKEYNQIFQQLQLQAIQELRAYFDLISLEYPRDAIGAVTVTAELDVPWLLSLQNTGYEDAKDQLRTSLESGAAGFVGIMQFLPSLSKNQGFNREQVKQYLKTSGRDRVIELRRIVSETSSENS